MTEGKEFFMLFIQLTKLPHLFEHKDTVSRTNKLGQLCDASLVKVRARETAVVEVNLRTAVFPVPLPCKMRNQ